MQLSINSPPALRAAEECPPLPTAAPRPRLSIDPVPLAHRTPRRNSGWVRRLHAVVGVVASLNLLLLLTTGFLLQHRETFGLDEKYIGRQYLPGDYRPQDGAEVRADIVVTDLHSGRLLGATGALILDAVTVGWFVLLLSGLCLFVVRNRRENGFVYNGNGRHEKLG